jgi:hypothetical protein
MRWKRDGIPAVTIGHEGCGNGMAPLRKGHKYISGEIFSSASKHTKL